MSKEQVISKIEKLLMRQELTGASKPEEYSCLKKVQELTLQNDIQEIDLDVVVRRIYQLEKELSCLRPKKEEKVSQEQQTHYQNLDNMKKVFDEEIESLNSQ